MTRTPPKTYGRARRLRRALSPPEVRSWARLKGGASGLKFRCQHPVGPYILDFFCAEAMLAVEVDGYTHEGQAAVAYDERRDGWLAGAGIETLRLGSRHVMEEPDDAAEQARRRARERIAEGVRRR